MPDKFPPIVSAASGQGPVAIPVVDRRGQSRRAQDRVIDDLHSTFSSSHCHTCLERMSDAALLLDSEMRVLFMSPSFRSMVQTPDELFVLAPKFGLRDPADARRLAELLSAPSQDNEKPCLMLHEGGAPFPCC